MTLPLDQEPAEIFAQAKMTSQFLHCRQILLQLQLHPCRFFVVPPLRPKSNLFLINQSATNREIGPTNWTASRHPRSRPIHQHPCTALLAECNTTTTLYYRSGQPARRTGKTSCKGQAYIPDWQPASLLRLLWSPWTGSSWVSASPSLAVSNSQLIRHLFLSAP